MTQPRDEGGLALPFVDAGLVHQVLGAELVPGPLIGAVLGAELISAVGSGDALATVVERVPAGGPLPAPTVLPHLGLADVLLVIDDAGVWRLDPAAVRGRSVANPLDPSTPVWLADGLPAGEQIGDAALAARWRIQGNLLASAQLAGLAVRVVEVAVRYAQQREQFGRVIGGFQAVKHLLADGFARAEVARAALDAATASFDEWRQDGIDGVDPAVTCAVAAARVVTARAAVSNAKTAIQVHGGMGFTWETTVHLYLKRAWLLQNAFTTVDEAAETLALISQQAS
jgi:hypothetical protein